MHRVEISLENTDPPVVFFPDQVVSANFDVQYLVMHQDQSFFFTKKETNRKRYQASFILNPLEIKDAPITDVDLRGWQRTYVNSFGIPKRIQSLAKSLASGAVTINQAVTRGMEYLNRNCKYSLYEEFSDASDPVEDFLFKSKAGSCEHFASALTLLLRGMNIAARPVSGYSMGEWNELGSFFTIRQRHAHTWVEVYFPGQGWVPFDPTPFDTNDHGLFDMALFRPLAILWEAYEGYWFRFVYSFDNKTQGSGFRLIKARLNDYLSRLWNLKLLWKDYLFFCLASCEPNFA